MHHDRNLLPYGVAFGTTAIALLLTVLLASFLTQSISILFCVAITVTTWYGGLRPGAIAIVLSTLAVNLFFSPPTGQIDFTISDVIRFFAFSLVGIVIHTLSPRLREGQQLSQQLLDESDDRLNVALSEAQVNQTLLRQQVEQQRLVIELTNRIRQSLNLEDILQTTVDEVRQLLQTDRVIIFRFLADWCGLVAAESCGANWTRILPTEIHDLYLSENSIELFKQGGVTAEADIYTAGIGACHLEWLSQFQVRANLGVPILKSNELWGVLIAHQCAAPRPWQNTEISLLQQIASQVGIALQQSALFEQVQAELVERRQADAALKESQSQLQQRLAEIETIYQSAPLGLTVLDTNLRFVRINQRLADMNGLSIEAHIGHTVCELLPDLANPTDQLLRTVLEAGEPLLNVEMTEEPPAQPGVQRTWVKSFLPLKDGDRVIGISTVCEEITERKRVEEALQQLNAELEQRVADRTEELNALTNRLLIALKEQHQSKQDIEDLYNNAPCGYHSLDMEGTVVRINDTELSWLGYTRDEVVNQMKFTDLLTPETQHIFYENFPRFMQEGWVNNLEFQLRHKDSSTRWVSVNAIAIKDDGGRFVMSRSSMFDISDRKQAEQTLALQAVITRSMAEGICLVKADDATIVYANPKFEQMFGYDSGELSGQHVSIVNYATETMTPEEVNQSIRSAVLQNGEASYEVHNVKKDGTPFWCRATCSVFNHPDYGNVLVTVQQDITHAKQAKAALQQQARLEALRWEITQVIRQSLDLKAILDTTAERMRQTLQVDRVVVYHFQPNWSGNFIVESVADGWVKLVDSDVQEGWQETYLQETQGGRFQNHETFVISDIYTAELHPCHIELLERLQTKAYALVPIFAGENLWGLLAIYQNAAVRDWQSWEIELLQQIASQLAIAIQQSELYSRLQLELQERQQTEAGLREAERRWRSLLENVQLIVVGLDPDGKVEYINPFFLTLAGYQLEEVLGKLWFDYFISPSYQSALELMFQEILEHGLHPHHQNPILTKSGEERMIAWSNTVLQNTSGKAIGTISIGEDITERYKVDRMKAEFISVVSHELRTPLTSMQAALSLLNEKIIDPRSEEGEVTIQIATEGTDRLVRLVNDILDLERLESGKMRLEKHFYNMSDLINTAVAQMQEMANQMEITLEASPCPVQVFVDGDRIIQILTNLLSNAVKFSPRNSRVQLSVDQQTAENNPPFLLFVVRDQGRGIPADKLESIFNRFHQVDASDSREKGGTGLGLAICRSIVQQHGGEIWAESTLGQGTTFSFTIPLEAREIRTTTEI